MNVSFIYDLHTDKIIYAAPSFRELLPGDPENLPPADLLLQVIPEDRHYVQHTVMEILAGALNPGFEFRLQTVYGLRWIRMALMVITLNSEKVVAGIAADITAEVNNLYTVRKFANKKNSVLNILAHDLRGPLGIVKALSQVIHRELGEHQLSGSIRSISKIVGQSLDLISNLLEREFLESINTELVKHRIDIVEKIREYIEEYQGSESGPEKAFAFSSNRQCIYITVDEAKFMQILNNLFTNALKFTPEGGTIALDVHDQENTVLFSFSDTGIGIPPEFLPVIFDKFTPARRNGLNGEPSVGLGLSIVKTIVEWHHGKVWAESEEGKGTTFFVELPKK